jgi:siroheme synthase-like protein
MTVPLLPIFVKLEGRSCLVVGGGAVALQKVRSLLECGAHVTVVAPDARDEIRDLAERGIVAWRGRTYVGEDVAGHRLVIAATNDPELNHAVYSDAVEAGVLANAVDDPPFCDFYFGSVVRRGPLQIGISTAGESPALAQRLRGWNDWERCGARCLPSIPRGKSAITCCEHWLRAKCAMRRTVRRVRWRWEHRRRIENYGG